MNLFINLVIQFIVLFLGNVSFDGLFFPSFFFSVYHNLFIIHCIAPFY